MGGTITVASELGHGASFTIHLPATVPGAGVDDCSDLLRIAAADAGERKSGNAGLSTPLGSQEKVLVVDDDHAFIDLTERLLRKEGYSPISTDAPQAVLQIARTVRPAAILLDILMPGLNGWDMLGALRSDPATSGIPVIMLSILDERKQALESGADGFLAKPIDGAQLQAALKDARQRRAGGVLRPAGLAAAV